MSVVQLLVDGEVDVFLLVAKPWGTRRSMRRSSIQLIYLTQFPLSSSVAFLIF